MLVSMGVERLSNERRRGSSLSLLGNLDASTGIPRGNAAKRPRSEKGEKEATGDIVTQLNEARAQLAALQDKCSGLSSADSIHKAEIKTKNSKIAQQQQQIAQQEQQIAQMRAQILAQQQQIQNQQQEIDSLTPDDVDMGGT